MTTASHGIRTYSDGGSVIMHNRKCRDVAFLIVFIAFLVSFIVNSSFGLDRGDPLRLTYGLDYKGNVCGDKHAVPNLHGLELRYWVNSNQVYQSGLKNSNMKLPDAKTICLLDCPSPGDDSLNWVCDYPDGDVHLSVDDWIDRNYDYFSDLTPAMRNTSYQLLGPCYPIIFPTINVYWSCQFIARASNQSLQHWRDGGGVHIEEDISIDKSIHGTINSRSSVVQRYIFDIRKAWPVLIVCGGLLPLFMSLFWLLLIRYIVSGMPWITVILFNTLMILCTMFYYMKAGWIGNDAVSPIVGECDPYYEVSGRELHHIRATAVLMTIAIVASLLSSIAIIRRILMATSVLKVAAKVIRDVGSLIVFPVIPAFILAIFYLFWFSVALNISSSGEIVQNKCESNCCRYDLSLTRVDCDRCCGYSFHDTPHSRSAIFFHLFGLYWVTQFFLAFSSTVTAGSVASYYWAPAETSREIRFLSVFSSMKRLGRYNLGSVALGSLVMSLVESLRPLLDCVRRKLKAVDVAPGGWIGRAVHHASAVSLRCVEWTMRSVNRNAYIMVAITGKSFCESSASATDLIISNIAHVGKVNVVGDVILCFGKLCVALSSAVFSFLMLDTHKYKSSHDKISSPLFPVLVCLFLGYVVATLFFGVVEMSIDTIILSFCQDSAEHQGTARYAPALLLDTLDEQSDMQRLMI